MGGREEGRGRGYFGKVKAADEVHGGDEGFVLGVEAYGSRVSGGSEGGGRTDRR